LIGLDVHLFDFPVMYCGESEEYSVGLLTDHRGKCFSEVDPVLLFKASHYPSGFEAGNVSVRASFYSEDPFTAEDVHSWLHVDEFPGAVLVVGGHFVVSGVFPVMVVWAGHGLLIGVRLMSVDVWAKGGLVGFEFELVDSFRKVIECDVEGINRQLSYVSGLLLCVQWGQ